MKGLLISRLVSSGPILRFRVALAAFRRHYDPWYIRRRQRQLAEEFRRNAPYERGDAGLWYPPILGLEETLRKIIDEKISVCRFGDGEFEIVDGKTATFQLYDARLRDRLREILGSPSQNCLCCIPDIYGTLDRYIECDQRAWRRVAVWSRERVFGYLSNEYREVPAQVWFGDTEISRPYLGIADKTVAPKIFNLWKELFEDKRLLVVEGRYSRLGIGNDMFDGAASVRRIWCPATNAFSRYDEILGAIKRQAKPGDLVLIALGMTATVLAYDLAKEGYWAVDAGHVDVEYMWMKMGVDHKVPIPGRYVNECADGHVRVQEDDEIRKYRVVETIGC